LAPAIETGPVLPSSRLGWIQHHDLHAAFSALVQHGQNVAPLGMPGRRDHDMVDLTVLHLSI
jgi:hypothetical protein